MRQVNCRISFSVDNERKVKFWKDKWCGDEPLSISFPSLFALATLKEAHSSKSLYQSST